MTPFGQRLRDLREQHGRALKDMARALKVSSAYLSALEHGIGRSRSPVSCSRWRPISIWLGKRSMN